MGFFSLGVLNYVVCLCRGCDVMDVVFFVCIVRRGAVGALYGECEWFVMQMLLTGHNSQKTQSFAFAQTNIHTANRIFTNIILMAEQHNIPKGKMHSNCRLLPEDIVCTITQRNNIRRANTCDPALKLLNEEMTSDIQKHKQNIWKEHIGITDTTHTLWKTIHGLTNS